MKIKTLSGLTFQRNGIAGEPFYHCFLTIEEKENENLNFIATFATLPEQDKSIEEDKNINTSSCRVVCLQQPENKWRGDKFAYALQKHFNNVLSKGQRIYDLSTNEAEYQEMLKKQAQRKIENEFKAL